MLVPWVERWRDTGLTRSRAYEVAQQLQGVVRLGGRNYVLLEQWPHTLYDGSRCPTCLRAVEPDEGPAHRSLLAVLRGDRREVLP